MGAGRRNEQEALRVVFTQLREALAPLGVHLDPMVLRLWVDMQREGALPFTPGGAFRPDVARRLAEAVEAIRLASTDGPESEQLGG